ncbi:hypothetical protein E8E14_010299 [Neopestalotiopsis sp. 37M]|nr:hypothetical protein E8E14_010299 [Neopestalotiopsis sp. 37M]
MGNLISAPANDTRGRAGRKRPPASKVQTLTEFCQAVSHSIHSVNDALDGKERRRQMRLNGEFARQRINWQGALEMFLRTSSIAACALEVLQGSSRLEEIGIKIHAEMQAQTGLDAPYKFAKHVSDYIHQNTSEIRSKDFRHLYFLYHPDTDWHGEFHTIVTRHELSSAFLGMSESLEALCAWMAYIRALLKDKFGKKASQHTRFHLLIPSYRPLAIKQPLNFDKRLLPLTIHGHIHDSQQRVWLNLPGMDDFEPGTIGLVNIGNIAEIQEDPGIWDQIASLFDGLFSASEPMEPVVLGHDVPAIPADPNDAEREPRLNENFHVQRQTTRHVSDKRRTRASR